MKIKLYKDSKIYVLAPSSYKTGGTELLHQYVFAAQKKYNCTIVYVNIKSGESPVNCSFKKYVNHWLQLKDIVDDEKNVLIVPEVFTRYLSQFKKIRKVIWWESVDNYLLVQ